MVAIMADRVKDGHGAYKLVSVVITNYNYAQYVGEAIESILGQTYKNIELVVIDDGSTDNSLDVISKYKDKLHIIRRENKGIVYTRNQALRVAKGEYMFFLDADDYFNNDYIEKMVAVATKSGADIVYPNWNVFGDKKYTKEFPEFDIQKLIRQEIHCTSESLIRLSAIGDHKFESKAVAEDWDFFLGLALDGREFKLAKDCYINYRVREGGRGTMHPYWDDMYHFYEILKKWSEHYPAIVNPVDLPVYAGKLRDDHIASQNNIIAEKDEIIQDRDTTIAQKDEVIRSQSKELANLTRKIEALKKPWRPAYRKMTGVLRKGYHIVRRARQIAKDYPANREVNLLYENQLRSLQLQYNTDNKFAVVIHLFYTDNWPLFNRKLNLLPSDKFDLFITLPEHNKPFSNTILKDYPKAQIILSPNRGRDVLPFMKVAGVISSLNYKTVLKFHSKKSTHRDDGQDWLESMLDQIIPDNKRVLDKILSVVKRDNFGVLGPANTYYPLTVNFPANGMHMTKVVTDLFGKEIAYDTLQVNRKDYGFFGGTMFWISTDTVEKLQKYSDARYFETESGQIDATFAHALERLFCVIPELGAKDIYESTGRRVVKRAHASNNIPSWSEDHDK